MLRVRWRAIQHGPQDGFNHTFHHVSKKHLDRYVDEFTFRLNAGKVSRHTTERLDSFVDAIAGKRITYAQLTKGKTWFDAEEMA